MSSEPAHTPSPRHGRVIRAFVAVSASLALLIAAGTAYGIVEYRSAGLCHADTCLPPPPPNPSVYGPCVDDVCNYLLLGSDSRAGLTPDQQAHFGDNAAIGGSNRADTIMLVHTDPKLQKAIILSFPRDLWVNIPGQGMDKINAAFEGGVAGGGTDMMARTVHTLTGLTINHILYVDLAGFEGVVETLGGVTMCISGENVNTPGYVDTPNPDGTTTAVYNAEVGHIFDPYTGLDVKPGCQTLDGLQALAYVRARHLRCDAAAPDFYRISRQQQFLRAVINRLLQPSELTKLPTEIGPIMRNFRRDEKLKIADLAYLVGQLRGITTGAAEFRSVPGHAATEGGLDVIVMDPSAKQIFKAIREGKPIGNVGTTSIYTPPSPATIVVPVIDRASGGKAQDVEQILSDSGFDVSRSIIDAGSYGSTVPGNVIAYAPGHEVEAAVVKQYLPGLELKEVKGLADHVAVFITASYTPSQVGAGGGTTTPPDCVGPTG
jgi:anionic cell wall polymer biosynthesis LytR-Cps2A-Psr (LCP) family protein